MCEYSQYLCPSKRQKSLLVFLAVSCHVFSRNVSLRVTDKYTIRASGECLSLSVCIFHLFGQFRAELRRQKREMIDSRETHVLINRESLEVIYETCVKTAYQSSPPRALHLLY